MRPWAGIFECTIVRPHTRAQTFAGYLVFPRWAQNGVGIVGHVETGTLAEGSSSEDVTEELGRLTLMDVQRLLEEAITRAAENRVDG
jgi:hypothetical protein